MSHRCVRHGSTYEVDDEVFGLTEEERAFRQMVFSLAQKELSPQVRLLILSAIHHLPIHSPDIVALVLRVGR